MPRSVAGKEQIPRRGQQAAPHAAQVMRPTNLSRFIVDRLDGPRVIQKIIAPGKSFGLSLSGQVKDAVTLRRDHVKKTGGRIETGSKPIRRAIRAGRDERTVTSRLFLRIGNGLALSIDPQSPIGVNEGGGQQMLAAAAVQHKEKSIPARLRQQFAPLALELPIKQNRRLCSVPVVRIVRR